MDAENGELKRTSVCRWITFRFITVCSQFLIDSPRAYSKEFFGVHNFKSSCMM